MKFNKILLTILLFTISIYFSGFILANNQSKIMEFELLGYSTPCQIIHATAKNVAVHIPSDTDGYIYLAVYDTNQNFVKIASVFYANQSYVEIAFDSEELTEGYFIKAFFLDDSIKPLLNASDFKEVLAAFDLSEILLTDQNLLSFYTEVDDATIYLNGIELATKTTKGQNLINVYNVSESNFFELKKQGYEPFAEILEVTNIREIRLASKIQKVYILGEEYNLERTKLEGSSDGVTWFSLPITLEQIDGFSTNSVGERIIEISYSKFKITERISVVTDKNQPSSGGAFSISPNVLDVLDTTNIVMEYTPSKSFYDGTIEITLPNGMVFEANDKIEILNRTIKISEIQYIGSLSDENRILVLNNLNLIANQDNVKVTLLDRNITEDIEAVFSLIYDFDGESDYYLGSEALSQEIELVKHKIRVPVTVSLPEDHPGLESDLDINIQGDNIKENIGFGFSGTLKPGERTLEHSFILEPGNYYFYYNVQSFGHSFMQGGYYTEEYNIEGTSTTPHQHYWSEVLVEEDMNSIDLHLLAKAILEGVIRLPADIDTLTEDLEVIVWPRNVGVSRYVGSGQRIRAGETETRFRIELVEGDYVLSYTVRGEIPGLLQEGYYTKYGSVVNSSQADIIRIVNGMPEIEIELIPGLLLSGKVTLPESADVLAEDLKIILTAYDANTDASIKTNVVTILKGERSIQYNLSLLQGDYYIKYSLLGAAAGYKESGYYSTGGTVSDKENKTDIKLETNLNLIDIDLLSVTTLSGRISLPDGFEPFNSPQIIFITWQKVGAFSSHGRGFWLEAGQRSVDYNIALEEGEYYIYYRLSEKIPGLLERGYYSEQGTVTNQEDAKIFTATGVEQYKNIDLTILSGSTVSGTISLPDGFEPLDNPISISIVRAKDDGSNSFGIHIDLDAGKRSVDYNMTLEPGNYYIYYRLRKDIPGLNNTGYYSDQGTVKNKDDAKIFELTDGEVLTNIDLIMLPGPSLSGKINLSDDLSPLDFPVNINILITEYGGMHFYSGSFVLEAGNRSVDYSISVVYPGEFYIYYVLEENIPGLSERGCYSVEGTVESFVDATLISISGQEQIKNIDLTILPVASIAGEIMLSSDLTPLDYPVTIDICKQRLHGMLEDIGRVTLEAGKRSVNYSVPITTGDYYIYYQLTENVPGLIKYGYYSVEGTVKSLGDATLISISGQEQIKNIDLQIK